MARGRFNQILIRLADASLGSGVSLSEELAARWLWLRASITSDRSEVVGNFVDGKRRSDAVIPKWPDPKPGKPVRFEIATELPVFIPNRGDQWEFELDCEGKTMLVANRMVRCRFRPKGHTVGEYASTVAHYLLLPHMRKEAEGGLFFIEPMRTVVSMAFVVAEGNGTDALEEHFWRWSEQLLAATNSLLDAIRVHATGDQDLHLNTNSRPTFLVAAWTGDATNDGEIHCSQLVGNLYDTVLLPVSNFTNWPSVDEVLAGKRRPELPEVALARAKTFLRFGYLDLAVVHVCLAAEGLLGSAFENLLVQRGVPEKVIKSRIREVSSLSLLLDIQASLFIDLASDTKAVDALKALGWARECRNKVVHRGGDPKTIDEARLKNAIEAVGYLGQVLVPTPGNQPNEAT